MRRQWTSMGFLVVGLAIGGCSGGDFQRLGPLQSYQPEALPQLAAAENVDSGVPNDTRTDVPQPKLTWLAMGKDVERHAPLVHQQRPELAGMAFADDAVEFVPWPQRRGPAYGGDFWHSLGRDAKEFPSILLDDTVATVNSPVSLIALAAAGVTGIVLSGDRGNDQVERHFTRNSSQLNTFWDSVGGFGGSPATHFAIAGGMYLYSLASEDTKTYEVSKTLLSALAINGLATMGLKVATRTESPNGDELGWPSGHTSSGFCFATVMYEAYGPWVGVPMYAFATFVGYQRVDARNHDFADVISGALIGIAIGHAVAEHHEMKIFGMDLEPYADPQTGAVGIALAKRW